VKRGFVKFDVIPNAKQPLFLRIVYKEMTRNNQIDVSKDSEIHDFDMLSNHFWLQSFMLFLEETWATHVPLTRNRNK